MNEGKTAVLAAMKFCKACQQEKPESDFYMRTRDGLPQGRMVVCKECHKARVAQRALKRRVRAAD